MLLFGFPIQRQGIFASRSLLRVLIPKNSKEQRQLTALFSSAARTSSAAAVPPQQDAAVTTTTPPQYAPIYVAATRQHVGKTSVSLALMSGLLKRFPNKVGFLKPVGQISRSVTDSGGKAVSVDKDACLIKDHFRLNHLSYQHTSPVLIPSGYTRDYLDGKITSTQQTALIKQAYDCISSVSDITLCEGTGHVAVGSIVDASNADIAAMLGAKVCLVVNGGLGNSFDELELNRNLCEKLSVEIAGVIINKVRPDKYEQTKHYLSKALYQKWGPEIPLIGCIPDRPFLGCPALADIERLFEGTLVSGSQHRLRHYRMEDLTLVATSLEVFLKQLRNNRQAGKRTLYVCHASRSDILLGFLMETVRCEDLDTWEIAMVVTGVDEFPISTQVMEIIDSLKERAQPVLLTAAPTDRVMRLYQYTPKLNVEDCNRVETAIRHYEENIDFDLLLERVQLPNKSTSNIEAAETV